MKTLLCSCCGQYFKGDQDPNHDTGYGTCDSCNDWIYTSYTLPQLEKTIKLLAENLNPTNKAKFLAMSKDDQLVFAMKAHEDGLINWEIKKHENI